VTYTTGQPQATANVEMAVNLNADADPTTYVSPTAPDLPATGTYNHTTSVTVYDTLGSEHTLTFISARALQALILWIGMCTLSSTASRRPSTAAPT
jgi:flagellar hook protein FlgE